MYTEEAWHEALRALMASRYAPPDVRRAAAHRVDSMLHAYHDWLRSRMPGHVSQALVDIAEASTNRQAYQRYDGEWRWLQHFVP